jgi:leader peptidase (prepilin peptidase)/N-methyltransferase
MWISPRYPAVELLNGLLWVALYWWEVPAGWGAEISDSGVYSALGPQGIAGSTWLSPLAVVHWRYFYHLVLVEALLVATFIDFDLWIIPDGVTVPAMTAGLLGSLLGQVHLVPVWFQNPRLLQDVEIIRDVTTIGPWLFPTWLDPLLAGPPVPAWVAAHPHWHGLAVSVAGFVAGGAMTWGVRIIGHSVLRREAMGFGDVILMAMIGSFLGWQPAVMVFLLAPACALLFVSGSVILHRRREFPYGPYLALATLVVLFGWPWLWPKAERVFQMGALVVVVGLVMTVLLAAILYAMQGLKWLCGMQVYPAAAPAIWTAADQNQFLDGERGDLQQGQWRKRQWPGILSSRGQWHWHNWRRPRG